MVAMISLVFSALALLVSVATFATNVLIRIDDLELMIADGPSMSGSRQEVTITVGSPLMTFLNMGNRPISVTSIELLVDETDKAGKPLDRHSALVVPVEPFIIKAGEIATKEVKAPAGTVAIKPGETTGNVKLLASFWLVTADGSVYASNALQPDLPLPASGSVLSVPGYSIVPREGALRMSPTSTLYHHRSFAFPW
jgi:hypothetical protein